MGLLIALGASMVALAAFSMLVHDAPPLAALATIGSSLFMIVVWLGHLWARQRREANVR